jgi:hypothetical protein
MPSTALSVSMSPSGRRYEITCGAQRATVGRGRRCPVRVPGQVQVWWVPVSALLLLTSMGSHIPMYANRKRTRPLYQQHFGTSIGRQNFRAKGMESK